MRSRATYLGSKSGAYQLQAYYRAYQGAYEYQPPHIRRFFKKCNAHYNSAYRSNACPYRIGGANRYGLDGFVKQQETHNNAGKEADAPAGIFKII